MNDKPNNFGRALIKGEGVISNPDEFDWKCGCAKCEERYRHWKNGFDAQQKALAQEALDKKAENARELGLDYEPIQCPICKAEDSPYPKCGCVTYVEQPAQQEPVAYLCENAVGHKYFRWKRPSSTYKPIALYTSPPAQQEYERGFIDGMQAQMKRSVDRAVNAMAQRTWVGLTDEEIQTEWVLTPQNDRAEGIWFGRRIEAKLKEKNT